MHEKFRARKAHSAFRYISQFVITFDGNIGDGVCLCWPEIFDVLIFIYFTHKSGATAGVRRQRDGLDRKNGQETKGRERERDGRGHQ